MSTEVHRTSMYPDLVLLVGMHRSGTSLLGSILQDLGVDLPGDLIEGDQHNQEGYRERRDVVALQEQLLIELGRWWPGPSGMLSLPPQWQKAPCTKRAEGRLRDLLVYEAAKQTKPWAIKDPRTSLVLPLWRKICSDLSIHIKLIHAYRDPIEVVLSLCQRDGRDAGMTAKRAQELWLHHNNQILQDCGNLPRLVIDYSRWFEPSGNSQLKALAEFCTGEVVSKQAEKIALGRINPEYRRSMPEDNQHIQVCEKVIQLASELASKPYINRSCIQAPSTSEGNRSIIAETELPRRCRLVIAGYGATACHWSIHIWLHRCRLPNDFELVEDLDAPPVGLHLQPLWLSHESGILDSLRPLDTVLDPNLERVQVLRELGIKAFWLDPLSQNSGWVSEHFQAENASELFGLPIPTTLKNHGKTLCLGSGGKDWERELSPPDWGLPGFDDLHVPDASAARLLAGWINECSHTGLQIIRLNPTDYERNSSVFSALDQPQRCRSEQWIPALLLDAPITSSDIKYELEWQRSDPCLRHKVPTPCPEHNILWHNRSETGASEEAQTQIGVCISLYNYRERVIGALESVLRQTHRNIELIIVDDFSSDGGELMVHDWLKENASRISRTLLLQHHLNAGLAAARNTAFEASESEWCFVLDADNSLEPEALALCMAIAQTSPSTTAVVHPLVELRSEGRLDGQPDHALLTRIPWQREALKYGNQIDAMALIRREHWKLVNGYTHIPDGWEDYDFWCKLIEEGLQGSICPQRLGVYNQHSGSMQATSTIPALRRLKRLMKARHPWLQFETKEVEVS